MAETLVLSPEPQTPREVAAGTLRIEVSPRGLCLRHTHGGPVFMVNPADSKGLIELAKAGKLDLLQERPD